MKRSSVALAPHVGVAVTCMLGLLACSAILGLEEAELYEPDAGNTTTGSNTGGGGAESSCADGVKNGSETGEDCGGGRCSACPAGEGCFVGTDCESLACNATGVCMPPVCTDMLQNGDESDIDCGGATCPKCAAGSKCKHDTDCGFTCIAGICGGACSPGEKQCVGAVPQTCDPTGTWQSGACDATTPQCCHGECLAAVAEGAVSRGINGASVSGCTCARGTDGTLWCCGLNSHGQLGNGSTVDTSSPVQVTALATDVAEVATGDMHTCARKTDGTLSCWGGNVFGQVGDGTTVDKLSPVQVSALGTNVVQVAVGTSHACARTADGSLFCWGANGGGRLGDGTTVNRSSPVQVAALGKSVAQVAAGEQHSCALKTDGTAWCWGANNTGQLGDGTFMSKGTPTQVTALGTNVTAVAAGAGHSCARKTDGTLWCWGDNVNGQLGDGLPGVVKSSPVHVASLGANVAEVATGSGHTCARKTDGTLWCWGPNLQGQLGDGTTVGKSSPVQVTPLGNSVARIAAGTSHTCATKTDGSLWCWGANVSGQLGDGTTASPVTSPKRFALGVCE